MNTRKCCICGAHVHECMGFVVVRDFLRGAKEPREICGKCGLWALLEPYGFLAAIDFQDLSRKALPMG